MRSGLAFLAFFVLILIGCDRKAAFDVRVSPQAGIWTYNDDLVLNFEIVDTSIIYDLTLSVEHSRDYPWENLYVEIENIFPDGDTLSRPLSLELADKRGKWQGECSGSTCEAIIDLQKSVFFPKKGSYQIRLKQHMRQDSIPGLVDLHLGLYLNETK